MPPVLLDPPKGASREVLGWSAALRHVLDAPQRIQVHYQPIVDLRSGAIRGFEALARFPQAPGTPPRDWFSAAAKLGCGGALEAQVVEAALVARPLLHRRRFLSVNISPAALLSPEVTTALAGGGRLDGIVIELVDFDHVLDPLHVRSAVDALRRRGAAIAVDGLGPGHADLGRATAINPEFVKLDGATVPAGAEGEALLATYCALALKLEAWLVVKSVETLDRLDTLVRVGVPLAQGFALGRPLPAMAEVARELGERIRQGVPVSSRSVALAPLVQEAPAVRSTGPEIAAAFARSVDVEHVVCVDHEGRPTGIVDRLTCRRGGAPRPALLLPATLTLREAAHRAVARPLESRFDPIVCVDQRGVPEGIVPVDRLLTALAR